MEGGIRRPEEGETEADRWSMKEFGLWIMVHETREASRYDTIPHEKLPRMVSMVGTHERFGKPGPGGGGGSKIDDLQ